MDNVINLPTKAEDKPEENRYIMVCGKCSCKSWIVTYEGNMECSYCELPAANPDPETVAGVVRQVPHTLPSSDIAEETDENVATHRFPDESFARRQVVKELSNYADAGTLCLIMGYRTDGRGRAWMDVRSEEQREWVKNKLGQLFEYVEGVDLSTENAFRTVPEDDTDGG